MVKSLSEEMEVPRRDHKNNTQRGKPGDIIRWAVTDPGRRRMEDGGTRRRQTREEKKPDIPEVTRDHEAPGKFGLSEKEDCA